MHPAWWIFIVGFGLIIVDVVITEVTRKRTARERSVRQRELRHLLPGKVKW